MKNTKVKNFILIIAQPMLNGSKATLFTPANTTNGVGFLYEKGQIQKIHRSQKEQKKPNYT